MSRKSVIISTGSYLPEKVLLNSDLEKIVDTSDEWIRQRSGIEERRIAAKDQTTGDMAYEAAVNALENGPVAISAEDIDGIIVATTTPDRTFPAVAVKLQQKLGVKPCPAFDVQAVCTGFVYAMSIADSFIKTGQCSKVLVVGADKMSSLINWEDRTTCVLFGDGAGCVVMEARDEGESGVLSTHLYANGNYKDLLYTDGGVSSNAQTGKIVMHGKEVFKYAVQYMSEVVVEALEKNNLQTEDIDWLVPHQANKRIIEATAKKLKLSMDKVLLCVDKHGNTSAASIPLVLDEAVREGKIQRNQLLLIEGMGGGLTWGASLVRF